jgi:DNA-directed RNA polymerase specialized sigma24 family protein
MYSLTDQEQLFATMLQNPGTSLTEILENEREYLFDFLLRMTRQYDRALDTIEEVFANIEKQEAELKTLANLRFALYFSARGLNREVWNVDTVKLENPALAAGLLRSGLHPLEAEIIRQYQEIDRFVSALAPRARECLLLNVRHEFTVAEVGGIMDIEPAAVEDMLRMVHNNARSLPLPKGKTLHEALKLLDTHEMPENRTIYMTDLQEIIGGINKGLPGRLGEVLKIISIIGVVAGGIYLYLYSPRLLGSIAGRISRHVLTIFR